MGVNIAPQGQSESAPCGDVGVTWHSRGVRLATVALAGVCGFASWWGPEIIKRVHKLVPT